MQTLTIIGGGLSGTEAAWQAAQNGIHVKLYEMRPINPTGAHLSGDLAELVCSNSLGSNLPDRASGVLKNELRVLNSILLECAEASALPAGAALAVDRESFARMATERIAKHPNIEVIREAARRDRAALRAEVGTAPEGLFDLRRQLAWLGAPGARSRRVSEAPGRQPIVVAGP